jgi:Right handed beta helix region
MSAISHTTGERMQDYGHKRGCKCLHRSASRGSWKLDTGPEVPQVRCISRLEAQLGMALRCWLAVLASLVPGCSESRSEIGSESATSARPAGVTSGVSRARLFRRYYVAPDGSDSNPGSRAAPFLTIQRGADLAEAGDTVIVRPGRYTGSSRIVAIERSGASDGWITFRSESAGAATLDGRDGQSLVGWYFGSRVGYIRVEGFEIRDLGEHAFDTYGGGVHDLMIVRNQVHHIGRNCTDTSNGRTGVSLGAGTHRVILDGNIWHDIGRFAPGEMGCMPRTAYYQNHDHGIYVADAHEITIRNNVFYNFARGWAIHRYSSRGSVSRGLIIVNNSFGGPNPYRPGQIIVATPVEGLRIENNIFHAPQTAAIYFENLRLPGASVRYNMVYRGVLKVGRPKAVTFSRNWEQTDPRIEGGSNFRLRYDSPAIDIGLPLLEVTHDADGARRPRGNGYDLGAYER